LTQASVPVAKISKAQLDDDLRLSDDDDSDFEGVGDTSATSDKDLSKKEQQDCEQQKFSGQASCSVVAGSTSCSLQNAGVVVVKEEDCCVPQKVNKNLLIVNQYYLKSGPERIRFKKQHYLDFSNWFLMS